MGFELRSSTGAKSAHRSTTGGPRGAARSAPPRPTAPEPAKKPDLAAVVSLKVFYATDRKPNDLDPDNPEIQRYGGEWDDQVHYGECRITLPEDRGLGAFPRPAWWRFDFQEDPERHIMAHSVTPMAEDLFFQSLSSVVGGSTTKEALVFVHGFNVSFKSAALRTAQLAVDLKFDGAPILYSWPARAGPMGAVAYAADANTIEKTYDHLTAFLQDVARRTGARRIHVLAHSMGNRAACNALERIAVTTPAAAVPIFGHVVLAAPDLDQQRFKQLVAKFQSHTSKVTLYASSKDKALKLSKRFNAAPRAGEPMVVLAGMDSVDASNVDTDLLGHGFFSDARSVLSDIFGVIRDEAVAKRFNLQLHGDHYRFRP
ncbi:alpha/beta hydrolase [Brevundimonas bullata]|uniref:alpha/beta hydrolase n=1 Tax=Brevundimonas bullata TaxID=13160 RepID=UPI003D9A838F